MRESLDPLELFGALQKHWMRIAAVGIGAALLALAISLVLPNTYEATVLLIIQPPSSGPNVPAAMSPAYLDSLRSYEQYVQSDGLVEAMLHDTKLDQPPGEWTVDHFRRSALRATMTRGTRILQLSVRLRDPQMAHATALRLAQMAVDGNSRMNRGEADRLRGSADKEVDEARKALTAAEAAMEKFRRESREDEIKRQVSQEIERKVAYQRQLSDLELDLTETEARAAALSNDPQSHEDQTRARAEAAGMRARRDALRATLGTIAKELVAGQVVFAEVESRRQTLENDYQAAERRFSTLSSRATEATAGASVRREELEIADPGSVPTRPDSPHPLQNMVLAGILGVLAAILWESWQWSRKRMELPIERVPARW